MAEVTVTKTVGVMTDRGDKDFEIHLSNGEVVTAERTGSKFRVGDSVGTLKEIKQEVVDGARWDSVADSEETDSPSGNSGNQCNPWDCIDPCAFLVYMICGRPIDDTLITETLDSYGWLTPEGKPDMGYAERQFKLKQKH